MRRSIRVVATSLALLILVGCSSKTPQPGPRHKWFNPYGQQVEDALPPTCAGDVPAPPAPPTGPPPDLQAGWNWTQFDLEIRSFKISSGGPLTGINRDFCVPVSIYAYGTAGGMPGAVVEIGLNGLVEHPMPFNGLRNTPWTSTILVKWPPDQPAPVINLELSAKYEVGTGLIHAPVPTDGTVGLRCAIKQSFGTLSASTSLDIFKPVGIAGPPDTVFGPFVKCKPPAFTAHPL